MNISEHLKKPYWKRRVNADTEVPDPTESTFYIEEDRYLESSHSNANFRYMTNADFLNEIEAGAHEINNRYWSAKPIKSWIDECDSEGNPIKDAHGKPKKVLRIVGYEDMETTRCSLPRRFAIAKASHVAANGIWIGNASSKHKDIFPNLLDWKDSSGLDAALFEVVLSLTQTCDAALYLYMEGGNITYKVFSYLYGDELFEDFDEQRRPRVWRLYSLKGRAAVDVISAEGYETWVMANLSEDGGASQSWWSSIKSWFKSADKALSDDGWRRISCQESQIGNSLCQCIYFRTHDIPSGVVADEISSWERCASYVAESMKDTAFPDKFVKATKIKNLPNPKGHGHLYGVEGSVEELQVADMKTVEAGDMSNIATTTLKTKMDAIMHGSMSVIIEPEILKAGADSSSALRLMFTSEIQWAQAFWVGIVSKVRYSVEVFKALVAKAECDDRYTKIRTCIQQRIWVPQNIAENVDNTTKLVYAGILSREAGASEVDLQYPDDKQLVAKEQEEEIYRKAFASLKAKADADRLFGTNEGETADSENTDNGDNPEKREIQKQNSPKVDNNANHAFNKQEHKK